MKETQVEVYGQTYAVRGELEPDYLRTLAAAVDAKMRALARQTDTLDTRRLAVLTALNLADELAQLKSEPGQHQAALARECATRLEQCNQELDAMLDSLAAS
jgi:cell division protein ZapA